MLHYIHINALPVAVIAFFAAAIVFGLVLAARKVREGRERFIREYPFPVAVRERLERDHPEWFPADIDRAIQELRVFFVACLAAPGMKVRMTSKPADDAWHEFILCTHDYEKFCRRAFGRFLHHKPDEKKPLGEAWAGEGSCASYVAAFGGASGHGLAQGDGGHGHGHGHGCSSAGHGCSSGGSCGSH